MVGAENFLPDLNSSHVEETRLLELALPGKSVASAELRGDPSNSSTLPSRRATEVKRRIRPQHSADTPTTKNDYMLLCSSSTKIYSLRSTSSVAVFIQGICHPHLDICTISCLRQEFRSVLEAYLSASGKACTIFRQTGVLIAAPFEVLESPR